MKLDFVTVASAAALIALALIGASMFKSMFENPKIVYVEAPLQKNTEFQLRPGEVYQYAYLMKNSSANMTFYVLEGEGCTRIRVMEARNDSGVCLDKWGNDAGGSNVTLDNQYMLLFRPWMLALKEGWTWNNSMYLSYGGAGEHITDSYYRIVRMENYSGRECYVVEIKSESGVSEYEWIDAERRVLLRVIGEGYEVVLRTGS